MATIILLAPLVGAILCGFGWRFLGEKPAMVLTTASVFLAAALLLAASVAGKLLGVHLAGRLLGWPRGDSFVIGWLLQTKALIMIVFANILLDKQIITHETFTALLLMAVASTALTIPMARPRLKALGYAGTEDTAQ